MRATAIVVAMLAAGSAAHAQQPLPVRVAEQRPSPSGGTLVTLDSRTIIEVSVGDLTAAGSLNALSIEPTCIPMVRVTLASKRVVFVPVSDTPATNLPEQSGCPASVASRLPSATPSSTAPAQLSDSGIRAKCEKDWPDDFQLRAFCERQQREARDKINGRAMASGDRLTIRTKCLKDWPVDFQMQNFCEEQQLQALDTLQRR